MVGHRWEALAVPGNQTSPMPLQDFYEKLALVTERACEISGGSAATLK